MEGTKLDLSALEPKLLAAVRKIAELVRAAGGRALMVGGSVRDLLLGGLAVKDVDLEVFGLEPPREDTLRLKPKKSDEPFLSSTRADFPSACSR